MAAILIAIYYFHKLDKILALSGTLLGTPLVMTFPAICHYKLVAKSSLGKAVDVFLVIISFVAMSLCTFNIVHKW